MPNIITHKIFGEEVVKKLQKEHADELNKIIARNLQLFYIGTNGPDFLFFYNAKPWQGLGSHEVSGIGNKLHRGHVNRFYTEAIKEIQKQKNPAIKERMTAYLLGHLCHWALDKVTHPYIFYQTGNCKGQSNGWHHRFESMIDTKVLKRYHHTRISGYPFYNICAYDKAMLQAIARIYVPVVNRVLNQHINVYDIHKALDDWMDVQKLLFDPTDTKFHILQKVEKVVRPWLISGNIVREQEDDTYDELNEQHAAWYHPCDLRICSTESFIDLFEKAIDIAAEVMQHTLDIIHQNLEPSVIGKDLNDQAYDTGMASGYEMLHFKPIYEED